jgi:glycosyltransferase involved in cell wall biosynthesis
MSTGCPVVGPKTPPVEEVLRHRENGLLVDFFDVNAIAATVVDGLANPEDYRALRQRARRTIIDNFDLRSLALPAQLRLLREVTEPEGPYLWKRRDR